MDCVQSRTCVKADTALRRGLGATLVQVTPSLAINYTAYGTLRSHWLERYGADSHTVRLPESHPLFLHITCPAVCDSIFSPLYTPPC